MKKLFIIIALIGLVAFSVSGQEQIYKIYTGNNLHIAWEGWQAFNSGADKDDPIKSITNPIGLGAYSGFVLAVAQMGVDLKMWTIPEGMKTRTLMEIVGKYLDDHPQLWDLPAQKLVVAALKESQKK